MPEFLRSLTKKSRFLDDWFGYVTPVYVKVLDPRLGALRYILILLILLYVVVYELLYTGEYVKGEAPVGTVRFSFREPAADCDPLDADCEVRLRPLTELPYCSQNPRADATQVLNCTFWDSSEAVTVSDTHSFLTSYIEEVEQERVCQAEDTSCKVLWGPAGGGASPKRDFIADVERFTLMLDHSVTAPSVGITGTARRVQGFLKTKSPSLCAAHPNRTAVPVAPGEPLRPTTGPPCYIMPNSTTPGESGGYDIFEMSTILEAANAVLDSPKNGSEEHSVRREGANIVLMIKYTNFKSWKGPSQEVYYDYHVAPVAGDAKQISVMRLSPDRRVVYNRHGVQIFVIQTGSLKAFDFLKLLVTLTTALTMLAVANFIVDSVALYILPERDLFGKAKYPKARLHDPTHRTHLRKHPAYGSSPTDGDLSISEESPSSEVE